MSAGHDFEIERGEKPAKTIRQLVNAQRQNFAGAGADLYSIKLSLNGHGSKAENNGLPIESILSVWAAVAPPQGSFHSELLALADRVKRLSEAVDRLEGHLKKADAKATLAFEAASAERGDKT